MTEILEVYEKYKHLDYLLSDKKWIDPSTGQRLILYDLWEAIKLATLQATLPESKKDEAEILECPSCHATGRAILFGK